MDLSLAGDVVELAAAVAAADAVHPVGARTHSEIGGAPFPQGIDVRAPGGIVQYDPADLTARVRAGTTVRELGERLGASGQECPLDPRDDRATIGGVVASGLSGVRRLRYGPLRDRVLEVSFVTAAGRLVRGGGPTVKNVSGFDLPRLLVGSLGTIGVVVEVVLRCQPLPLVCRWSTSDDDPEALRARAYRPSAMLWDGSTTAILLEGHGADVEAEQRALGSEALPEAPVLPEGRHRGRISVRPQRVRVLGAKLRGIPGARWLAEVGVGTVHVASDDESDLANARAAAEALDGWLLREAGAPGLDGFGRGVDNPELTRRVREAFDPAGKLAPGRLP